MIKTGVPSKNLTSKINKIPLVSNNATANTLTKSSPNDSITLPPIVEAQVMLSSDTFAPYKSNKNRSDNNANSESSEVATLDLTNGWAMTHESENDDSNSKKLNSFSKSNNFQSDSIVGTTIELIDLPLENKASKSNALKKIATSSTLNSYGGKSSSRLSTTTNTNNSSSRRKFNTMSSSMINSTQNSRGTPSSPLSTMRRSVLGDSMNNRSSELEVNYTSLHQQDSYFRAANTLPRRNTSLSLVNDETIGNYYKKSSSSTFVNPTQRLRHDRKDYRLKREVVSGATSEITGGAKVFNRRSTSLNRLNDTASFGIFNAKVENSSSRPKTFKHNQKLSSSNIKSHEQEYSPTTSPTKMTQRQQTIKTDEQTNNNLTKSRDESNIETTGLSEFTLMRILKWLQDIDECNNMKKPSPQNPLPHEHNEINSGSIHHRSMSDNNLDYSLSDYDSFDDQIIEYNRVVDKTFHVVHDDES